MNIGPELYPYRYSWSDYLSSHNVKGDPDRNMASSRKIFIKDTSLYV